MMAGALTGVIGMVTSFIITPGYGDLALILMDTIIAGREVFRIIDSGIIMAASNALHLIRTVIPSLITPDF